MHDDFITPETIPETMAEAFGDRQPIADGIAARERLNETKQPLVDVSGKDQAFIIALARAGSQFFASISGRDKLYPKQIKTLRDEQKRRDDLGGIVVAGVRVRNKFDTCWIRGCKAKATVAVGDVGVCSAHVADQQRADELWRASRNGGGDAA